MINNFKSKQAVKKNNIRKMLASMGIGISFIVALFLFSGCTKEAIEFDGSRTSNEQQFILDFDILNISLTHIIELQKNDILDIEIIKDKGELYLSVTDFEGNSIYKGDDASSGKFSLEITQSESYTFKVTGREASGFVSFIVRK